jgi:putative drug exporter of the RND superfamily
MYRTLGTWVTRLAPATLVVWFAALASLMIAAPAWQDVIAEGEFAFLPAEMPSLRGERVYEDAWGEPLASNVVIVVRRERSKLDEDDRAFIEDTLKPELASILRTVGIPEAAIQGQRHNNEPNESDDADIADDAEETIEDFEKLIKTFGSTGYQKILDSADGTATMVLIELQTEFFNARNRPLIDAIEHLIARDGKLYQMRAPEGDGDADSDEPLVPRGLHLALSGSATVGRDMIVASTESSKATEQWTVILVVALLILIYRAPVLAIIPLVTVGVATELSLALLAVLAEQGVIGLFNGIEVYVKILCYGAGVDYCLFLIARFKEELDEGQESAAAVSNAVEKAGEALVASAGTVICGIGMMVFADFGKFREAGVAITIGLVIVLLASLTFTPAILRLTGRWSFWPHVATRGASSSGGWVSATGLMASLLRKNLFESLWKKISEVIAEKPAFVLTLSIALMLPFSVIALVCFDNLSYGLLTELPQENTSVLGAKAIQTHYPAGIAGPVILLIHNPDMDFADPDGQVSLKELINSLNSRRDELNLADIRSVVHPFGVALEEAEKKNDESSSESTQPVRPAGGFAAVLRGAKGAVERLKTQEIYVGQKGSYEGTLARIDFVSNSDPFSRDSIRQFVELRENVLTLARKLLPSGDKVELYAIGPTASIRDLKTVTDRDQRVVDALVLGGVFLILVVLLRQFIVPVYLIVSVFFSYLVTLGVTFALFWALDPSGFAGLDWKVPTFLFTILIAVGEDYNIFLMTRIREEQIRHGAIAGVGVALTKTGSIISSCGIIMAGTFSSLLAGTLAGMHQLGFALAFGVLLDTFVVRPILVPAFLVLLYQGRLGIGAPRPASVVPDTSGAPSEEPDPSAQLKPQQ